MYNQEFDYDINIHTQDIVFTTCSLNNHLVNMTIKRNIHVVMSLIMSLWSKWFLLHKLPSSFNIWNQNEAIMYRTWILKIPQNSFNFQPLTIFQTQPKLKFECIRKMSHIFQQYSFRHSAIRTGRVSEFKKWPVFKPSDIIHDIMSAWHLKFAQLDIPTYIPAKYYIAPVLHC